MERLQFKIDINADKAKVYQTMIGKDTFKQWTAVFNPSSDFEGSWETGGKILFIGYNEDGKREGMVGIIEKNNPDEFVSIQYIGLVDGDKEITEGVEIENWAGMYENYSFTEENGVTILTVDIDMNDEMKEYFQSTYPQALNKLKEMCED